MHTLISECAIFNILRLIKIKKILLFAHTGKFSLGGNVKKT